MIISAYLQVAGLSDIGYQFYNVNETANGSRITAGILNAGDGWYSADATFPSGIASVRWNSAGQPQLIAREYFGVTVDNNAIAAAVWQTLVSTLTTAGSVGKLIADNLDAKVSTRSTYAGTDTAGTVTLLSRIASALTITGGKVDVNDKTGFSLIAAYDPAKTSAQAGAAMTLTAAYDKAKTAAASGDAMTLTSPYDAAKTAATQASVNTISGYVDTEVAAIKVVTDKLGTAVEIDGAVYRFTTNALEQAPVSGGGGATDWTAPEREQIRSRLGLDGTATIPAATNPIASQMTSLAIQAKTNSLPSDPADASDIAASFGIVNTKLDNVNPQQIADAVLTRDWTAVSGEASSSLLQAMRSMRNKWTIDATGVLKVYREDGVTVAWQRNILSTANAVPVTGME